MSRGKARYASTLSTIQRKKTPTNPLRKLEYEKEQAMMKKILQQEEMAKKRAAYREKKKQLDDEELKSFIKGNVQKQVQENEKNYFKFTKDLSIQRAIENIQMIEEMSKKNDKIQTRFLKNTVVNNILDRKKELN